MNHFLEHTIVNMRTQIVRLNPFDQRRRLRHPIRRAADLNLPTRDSGARARLLPSLTVDRQEPLPPGTKHLAARLMKSDFLFLALTCLAGHLVAGELDPSPTQRKWFKHYEKPVNLSR